MPCSLVCLMNGGPCSYRDPGQRMGSEFLFCCLLVGDLGQIIAMIPYLKTRLIKLDFCGTCDK